MINNRMNETLNQYVRDHKANNPDHRVLAFGNFTYCYTCHDHAHYVGYMILCQHNADYSICNQIVLPRDY